MVRVGLGLPGLGCEGLGWVARVTGLAKFLYLCHNPNPNPGAGAGGGGGGGRARWVTEHAAMVVLLANSVAWTRGVEAAILCGQVG